MKKKERNTMNNTTLYQLNNLYWFKDSFKDVETTVDFLRKLRLLADELEADGLAGDIDNYLLELNGR